MKFNSKSRTKKILAATWAISIVVASPYIFSKSFPFVITSHLGSISRQICTDRFDEIDAKMYGPGVSERFRSGFFFFLFSFMYLLPMLVILATCVRIAVCLLQPIAVRRWPPAVRKDTGRRHEENKRKVARMVIVVAVAFILSWSPFYLCNLVAQIQNLTRHENFLRERNFVFTMLLIHLSGFLNSCINPLIYTGMSKKFRRSFKKILGGCICCRLTNRLLRYRDSTIRHGPFTSSLRQSMTEVRDANDLASEAGSSSGTENTLCTMRSSLHHIHNHRHHHPHPHAQHHPDHRHGGEGGCGDEKGSILQKSQRHAGQKRLATKTPAQEGLPRDSPSPAHSVRFQSSVDQAASAGDKEFPSQLTEAAPGRKRRWPSFDLWLWRSSSKKAGGQVFIKLQPLNHKRAKKKGQMSPRNRSDALHEKEEGEGDNVDQDGNEALRLIKSSEPSETQSRNEDPNEACNITALVDPSVEEDAHGAITSAYRPCAEKAPTETGVSVEECSMVLNGGRNFCHTKRAAAQGVGSAHRRSQGVPSEKQVRKSIPNGSCKADQLPCMSWADGSRIGGVRSSSPGRSRTEVNGDVAPGGLGRPSHSATQPGSLNDFFGLREKREREPRGARIVQSRSACSLSTDGHSSGFCAPLYQGARFQTKGGSYVQL